MAAKIGVWLDHRQAVVVRLSAGEPLVQVVLSGIEPKAKADEAGSQEPYGAQHAVSGHRDRRYTKQLHDYYLKVMDALGPAEQVLLLGPGEAKQELLTELKESARFKNAHCTVQATDKLSQPQIIALIKEHFGSAKK